MISRSGKRSVAPASREDAGSRQIKRSQARAVCPSPVLGSVGFFAKLPEKQTGESQDFIPVKRQVVQSPRPSKSQPTGLFAPQLTAGSRQGENCSDKRPPATVYWRRSRTACPVISGVLVRVGMCVYVSVCPCVCVFTGTLVASSLGPVWQFQRCTVQAAPRLDGPTFFSAYCKLLQ